MSSSAPSLPDTQTRADDVEAMFSFAAYQSVIGFQISKAAFKRALGHLMKEGRVAEKDGWTYLLDVSAAADSEKDRD